jgi:transmembrane sensor
MPRGGVVMPYRRRDAEKAFEEDPAIGWFLTMQRARNVDSRDRAALERWLSDPEHAKAYEDVLQIWETTRQGGERPEMLALRRTMAGRVALRRRTRVRHYAAAAAIAVITVGATASYMAGLVPWHFGRPATARSYATAIGQRSNIALEDGSVLTLNTDTLAKVSFGKQRAISLEHGEALFQVAKGDKRLFVVYAGDRRVVATGTSFNVRVEDSTIAVTLVEGHVVVDQRNSTPGSLGSKLTELRAGEKLVAAIGGTETIGAADLASTTAWTSGRHVFNNVSLGDAVAEVNRYTDTPVRLTDDSLAETRISGVYPMGRPADFAKAVSAIQEMTVSYDADGAISLRKKYK